MDESNPWYFVDTDGHAQGPVSAAVVIGRFRSGGLDNNSLLWREGLDDWRPLSALRDELGLAAVEPPRSQSQAAEAQPYAPPAARLDTPAQHRAMRDDDVVPAGFLRRWAALFIDYLILGVAYQILQTVLAVFAAIGSASLAAGDVLGGAVFGVFFIGMGAFYFLMAGLYFALMESSRNQATLGKMALGIKVTDLSGRRLAFGQALGRWAAAALSYLTLWIGFLMAAFTERKRALHDFIAGTQVVDRWAYTDHPEHQQRGLSGCLIALLVVMAMALLMALALAVPLAVALPAYRDALQGLGGEAAEAASAMAGLAPADRSALQALPTRLS